MEYKLTTPLTREMLAPLRAGDTVLLSGVVYTARDAAHGRIAKNEIPAQAHERNQINPPVAIQIAPKPPAKALLLGVSPDQSLLRFSFSHCFPPFRL